MSRTPHEAEDPRTIAPADVERQDARLQRMLREDQVPVAPAALEALNARVLAQWHERHGGRGAREQRNAGTTLSALLTRRPVWIGTTGLLVAGAVLLVLWTPRPDPVLEELMQLDVLSQMAAGQM